MSIWYEFQFDSKKQWGKNFWQTFMKKNKTNDKIGHIEVMSAE